MHGEMRGIKSAYFRIANQYASPKACLVGVYVQDIISLGVDFGQGAEAYYIDFFHHPIHLMKCGIASFNLV